MNVGKKIVAIAISNLFGIIFSTLLALTVLIKFELSIFQRINLIILTLSGLFILIYSNQEIKILIFLLKRLYNKHKLQNGEGHKIEAILKEFRYDNIKLMGRSKVKTKVNYCYFICEWKNEMDKKTYEFMKCTP